MEKTFNAALPKEAWGHRLTSRKSMHRGPAFSPGSELLQTAFSARIIAPRQTLPFQGRCPKDRGSQGRCPKDRGSKAKIIILAIILSSHLRAQPPTTPSLDLPLISSLETSLQNFYTTERDAKLTAFDQRKSSDWQDLLPSVGLTYTVTNDPRPTISWSPLSILNRKDNRRRQEQGRQAITYSYEVLINDHLFKLHQLIHDYYLDLDALKTKEESLHIDELIFTIAQERHNQNHITPKEFLTEQKKIILARATLYEFHTVLQKNRSAIIYHAKWESQR